MNELTAHFYFHSHFLIHPHIAISVPKHTKPRNLAFSRLGSGQKMTGWLNYVPIASNINIKFSIMPSQEFDCFRRGQP